MHHGLIRQLAQRVLECARDFVFDIVHSVFYHLATTNEDMSYDVCVTGKNPTVEHCVAYSVTEEGMLDVENDEVSSKACLQFTDFPATGLGTA